MNIPEIRRNILSYLRKEPKISCYVCNDVILWDKKIRKSYYKDYTEKEQFICGICYYKKLYFNVDFISITTISFFPIYFIYLFFYHLLYR